MSTLQKNKQVNAYYSIVSVNENNVRIDTITRFDLDGKKVEQQTEKYIVTNDTLYKLSFDNERYPYLVVDDKNCNLINRQDEIETCLISDKEYLVFTEQMIVTDGVKKKLTFDKRFNLIENEYLDGYLNYYKISRRDNKPNILISGHLKPVDFQLLTVQFFGIFVVVFAKYLSYRGFIE